MLPHKTWYERVVAFGEGKSEDPMEGMIYDLQDEVDKLRKPANKFRFLNRVRVLIHSCETDWSRGFSDSQYVEDLRAKFKAQKRKPFEFKEQSSVYRKWSWILHFSDESAVAELRRLQRRLNEDRLKYHHFASSIKLFCTSIALNSNLATSEDFDVNKFNEMLQLIGEDIGTIYVSSWNVYYILVTDNKE